MNRETYVIEVLTIGLLYYFISHQLRYIRSLFKENNHWRYVILEFLPLCVLTNKFNKDVILGNYGVLDTITSTLSAL